MGRAGRGGGREGRGEVREGEKGGRGGTERGLWRGGGRRTWDTRCRVCPFCGTRDRWRRRSTGRDLRGRAPGSALSKSNRSGWPLRKFKRIYRWFEAGRGVSLARWISDIVKREDG